MFKFRNFVFILAIAAVTISCKERTKEEVSKDVVEDMDNILKRAEDDVKKVVIKDSSISIEERIRREDSINERLLNQNSN